MTKKEKIKTFIEVTFDEKLPSASKLEKLLDTSGVDYGDRRNIYRALADLRPLTKVCSICEEVLSVDNFYFRDKKKDLLHNMCIPCYKNRYLTKKEQRVEEDNSDIETLAELIEEMGITTLVYIEGKVRFSK
jgi:uncharacterized protein YlaI